MFDKVLSVEDDCCERRCSSARPCSHGQGPCSSDGDCLTGGRYYQCGPEDCVTRGQGNVIRTIGNIVLQVDTILWTSSHKMRKYSALERETGAAGECATDRTGGQSGMNSILGVCLITKLSWGDSKPDPQTQI